MLTSCVFNNTKEVLDYARENNYYGVEWYLNKFRLMINTKKAKEFFNDLDQYPELFFTFHLPTNDIDTVLKVNPQTLLLTPYFILNTLKKLDSNIFCLISIHCMSY